MSKLWENTFYFGMPIGRYKRLTWPDAMWAIDPNKELRSKQHKVQILIYQSLLDAYNSAVCHTEIIGPHIRAYDKNGDMIYRFYDYIDFPPNAEAQYYGLFTTFMDSNLYTGEYGLRYYIPYGQQSYIHALVELTKGCELSPENKNTLSKLKNIVIPRPVNIRYIWPNMILQSYEEYQTIKHLQYAAMHQVRDNTPDKLIRR